MSRYRNDRDDEYEGGSSRYGRGREDEETFDSRRGDYRGGGRGRDYDDYPRGREYGGGDDRSIYRRTERRDEFEYGGGGGGGGRRRAEDERAGYGAEGRREPRGYEDYRRGEEYPRGDDYRRGGREYYDRDEEAGRSLWDEGREYFRRTFGQRGRERRGAARSHVRCRDIMTRDVTVAQRATTLEEVARMMRDEDTGVIPVVERPEPTPPPAPDAASADVRPEARSVQSTLVGNGRLIGLITDRDLVVRAIAEGKDARTTRVEEIMTTEIHTAQPNDRVLDAVRKMGDKQVRRIPIVDRDGTLRGIISMADVALETEEDRELADALEEISSGSSFWNRVFG